MLFRLRLSSHTIAFLTFIALYILALQYVRKTSWRDPGSYFFDPERAFQREYSSYREEEAVSFVTVAAANNFADTVKTGPEPSFCVGIPTVQRDGARYFRRAMGSVLAGLTEVERRDLYVVPFIVNVDPNDHQAYSEPWLRALADHVLTYPSLEQDVQRKAQELEQELYASATDPRKKGTFDYIQLLKHCYARETSWVLLLEDDAIAADGWYKRTKDALSELVTKSDYAKTVYLRLFYNERLLGWNNEETSRYVVNVIWVELLVLIIGLAAMRYGPSPVSPTVLTPFTLTTIVGVVTPMCIALYFLAGRLTIAGPSTGLHRMDTYGCCSQAFVFPRDQIPGLIAWYEKYQDGYLDPVSLVRKTQIDSLTEIYANENGLARYALTPSVFQHVGGTSTKPTFTTRWGRSNAENIWNFGFERLDPRVLAKEHYD